MRLLLALLLLAVAPADAQDWTVLPVGTTQDLRNATQDQFSSVWVVGDSGYVFKSNATRTAYARIDAGTVADLASYVGSVNSTGMVSGEAGAYVWTSNGTNWFSRPIPDATQSYVVSTQASGQALAAGSAGRLFRTTNNGSAWTEQTVPVVVPLHGLLGETTVVGGDGVVLVLAGGTWEQRPTGVTADLYDIVATGNNTQVIVGEGGTLLRRAANGVFSLRPSGTSATLRAVTATRQSANFVIAVGDGGTALKSTDGGATWCALSTGTTADLFGVSAPTNAEYVIVGAGGLVLRTTTGGGPCTPIVVASEPDPDASALALTAAPNPASGRVALAFVLAEPGPVRLVLLDALGREVSVLAEGERGAGPHEARFDAGQLAPGVYLARLTAGGASASRVLTVVR